MGWDHILGHDAIRDRFTSAFARGRLGQAYLFVGPAGVGKKLFATELAKSLLCERPPQPLTACDRCSSCSLVAADTHPDFATYRRPEDKHELPVEVIHDLTARVALKSVRGARKIAVLEDTDDLSDTAANAFLKTLEEPPPGSLLILLATAAEAQLSTILSRCQLVRFRPLSAEVVQQVLTTAGTDAAHIDRLVQLSRGSAGQALALADDAVWEVRRTILDSLTGPRPNPAAAAAAWTAFVDDAGKDAAAQRRRVSQVVRLLIEVVSQATRVAVGISTEDRTARALADRLGPDGLDELLERCVEADYHVDRRVQLALVIDALTDAFAKPAA